MFFKKTEGGEKRMRDIPESELEDVFERYGNMVYRLAFAYADRKSVV